MRYLKSLHKSIPYLFFTVCAYFYYFVLLPFYYFVYKFLIFKQYKVSFLREDFFSVRSFVFLIKDGNKKFLLKKKNPVWVLYNRIFLRDRFLPREEFGKALKDISKNDRINYFLPDMRFLKKVVLVEFLGDEYVSLRDATKSSLFDEQQKNRIIDNLLECLKKVHSHGYSHGDLKSKNVFIKKNDLSIKLIDLETLSYADKHQKRDLSLFEEHKKLLFGTNEEQRST